MTDRFHSLAVVLDHDIRDDDCEMLINAIRMIRGVQSVTGCLADSMTYMAEQRAINGLGQKIIDLIHDEFSDDGH